MEPNKPVPQNNQSNQPGDGRPRSPQPPRPAGAQQSTGGGQKNNRFKSNRGRRPNGPAQRPQPLANAIPVNKSIYNGTEGQQATRSKTQANPSDDREKMSVVPRPATTSQGSDRAQVIGTTTGPNVTVNQGRVIEPAQQDRMAESHQPSRVVDHEQGRMAGSHEQGRMANHEQGRMVDHEQRRMANQVTRDPKLRIIPLGGLGEIGKNMMAIEYGNDIVVIDMGFKFPTDDEPGIDYIIPDVTYLVKNKHKIRGHILTHAHEDHMGGIPFILPKLPAPIYTARFSAGMVEKKLVEYKLQTQPQLRVMDPDKHERVQLGVFNIELVRTTHSIPDACSVVVRTPLGIIFHTGDFRFDPSPIDNKPADIERMRQIGDEGVLLLLSDSTSCLKLGRTPSEREIEPTFENLFRRQKGRIIISSFASQINRVQLVVDAAHATGRKLAFTGRSMLANVELAVKLGYLKIPGGMIIRVQDAAKFKDAEVVVLCTGSQGELNSALTRMSTGDHPQIKIKPGDAVIMSSNPIPGNEKSVVSSVDALMREGSWVYQQSTRELDDCGPLHVSGHASRDELTEMIQLARPKYFMPQHGEFHMLVRHAELAVTNGIPKSNIFVLDNGDVLEIGASGAKKGERVPSGMIMIDGSGVGDVEGVVLRDRLAMAGDGIFVIVATVSRREGKLISSPDIISRGFVYMKENEDLINRARAEVRRAFERRNTKEPTDWAKFKLKLRDEIGDFLYGATKRNPMIITVINEV